MSKKTTYRIKPGKIGQKVIHAYKQTEQAFTENFLQEDPASPSGYSLKGGKTRQRMPSPGPTTKSKTAWWAPTKRSRPLL